MLVQISSKKVLLGCAAVAAFFFCLGKFYPLPPVLVAVGSYFLVLWNVGRRLKGRRVEIQKLDVIDLNTADVRFLQASRHGEVLTPIEFIENHRDVIGLHFEPMIHRLHQGEPLGQALVAENVSDDKRRALLGKFISEELATVLDNHYKGGHAGTEKITHALTPFKKKRVFTQWMGALSFVPFIGILIWHAINHEIPLFLASFSGFAVVLAGIYSIPKMRGLALHGLDIGLLHLFSMAQIAGYAAGGCWTHIGSAQSVVAYSFIQKEVNEHYTPYQWIKAMTPIMIQIFILMTIVVYGEALIFHD